MKKALALIALLSLLGACAGDDTKTYLERFLGNVYSGKKITAFLSRMHPVLAKEVRMKSLPIFSAKANLSEKIVSHSLSSITTKQIQNRKFIYGLIKEERKNGTKGYRTFLAKFKLKKPKTTRSNEKGIWVLYDLVIKKGRMKPAAAELIRVLEPSLEAKKMLSSITNRVSILVFDTRQDTLSTHLLKEIAIHSKDNIQLEFLNPYIERGSAASFKINGPGYIVVLHGKNTFRINRDWLMFRRGKTGHFQGERVILSAIRRVLGHNNRLHYLTGHGERPDTPGNETHWSKAVKEFELCGLQVDKGPISAKKTGKGNVLCMTAPLYPPSTTEMALLRKHFKSGGTALFFLEKPTPTPLRQLLAEWGIEILPHTIVDPKNKDFIKGPSWFECHIPDTALTEAYTGREEFKILLGGAVGMRIKRDTNSKARAHAFITTTTNGWAEASYEKDKPDDVIFTPGYDIKGPISLAYSVTGIEGKGRALVFGDSDFISDRLFTSKISNWLFFLNSLSWLTDSRSAALPLRSFKNAVLRSFL